jgi:hypothetical protein
LGEAPSTQRNKERCRNDKDFSETMFAQNFTLRKPQHIRLSGVAREQAFQ